MNVGTVGLNPFWQNNGWDFPWLEIVLLTSFRYNKTAAKKKIIKRENQFAKSITKIGCYFSWVKLEQD